MELTGLQWDLSWESRDTNFAQVRERVAAARLAPGSLLVLPEMFATGFSMDVAQIADGPARETEVFLADLARQHGLTVLGGVVRKFPDGRGANEAVAFGPDGAELARYRKLHPFSPAGEADAFTAGDEVVTFRWNGYTVAPLICYDLRFPEPFRAAVDAGANLFAVIASWPARRHAHWTLLLQARAIENQALVIGVNRCGTDPHASYQGGSLICDPLGNLLTHAGEQPTLLRAAVNAATVTDWRAAFPALRDRRPDSL